jgi:chromosome segregation ATPase
MSDELHEELETARAEVERLQVSLADREARAAHLEELLSGLRAELSEAQRLAGEREQHAASLSERAEALETGARAAAERYRALALRQTPELPEELVSGDTIDEVDASIERARETVSKVRGHLESEAQAGRVPVGAPPRSEPDLSGLSAQEKISYGLQRREG